MEESDTPGTARREQCGVGLRLLDFWLPPAHDQVDVEGRMRSRAFVAIDLAILANSLMLVSLGELSGRTWMASNLTLVVGGLTLALLVAARMGTPIEIVGQALITILYCAGIGLTLATGGEAIGATAVTAAIPLVALALLGRSASLFWAGAVALGFIATAWFRSAGVDFPLAGAAEIWSPIRMPMMLAFVAFLTGTGTFFDWLNEKTLETADRSERLLGENEARYRALAESAGDVVTEIDSNLCFSYVSPNSTSFGGWYPEDLLGHSYADFVHPNDVERMQEAAVARLHDGGTGQTAFRFRHKNGQWIPVEVSSRIYRNESGEICILSVARNVSGLRRAEEAVRRSERLASTGTLAAGIVHQINDPVASIRQASEYALMALCDGDLPTVQKALRANAEQARRCGLIVQAMLHFVRQESIPAARGNLVEVTREAVELSESYAHSKSCRIQVHVKADPLLVEMAAVQIEQAIVSVLRNAIESGPTLIHVTLSRKHGHSRIEIRDQGEGIPAKIREQIFDPFFTTRNHEGAIGLGLSVAHGIVEQHDGRMGVESASPGGTLVWIELPLAVG